MSAKLFRKYLENHAEPEIRGLDYHIDKPYDAFCIIPIFDEPLARLEQFLAHKVNNRVAYIWVINCPDNASESAQLSTQNLLRELRSRYTFVPMGNAACQSSINSLIDLYLIDRCSNGMEVPAKQGVGLARKLGMDLAIHLYQQQLGKVWIHSCDADVALPNGYFDIPAASCDQSAAVYSFEHVPEPGFEEAMALYDFKLRYYQRQLEWVGSPYAFHTIGSTIAVTPLAYVQVRGMPKRSGGEDFYFLNKLAKVGAIEILDEPVLSIAGRPSERVPFGTGPALLEISNLANATQEYRYYQTKIFDALKGLITIASEQQSYASIETFYSALKTILPVGLGKDAIESLVAIGFTKKFEHIRQGRDECQIKQRFHTWFDAFMTLKFIHTMRDTFYPSIPLDELPDHVKVGILDNSLLGHS